VRPIVSGAWLLEHLADVRVVDVRWYLDGRSGRDAYLGGHLPGAVWLDLDTELSSPASDATGRHPLPTPEQFAASLGRAGIGDGTPVVAYDDLGGSVAARLWWLLHVLAEPVAVLDGGLAAWPGPLVTDVPTFAPVERPARRWPADRFVDADQVAATGAAVYDARTGGSGRRPSCASGSPMPPAGARSPTAAPGSPAATTCSRWSWPAWTTRRSTRGRGRNGPPTSRARPAPGRPRSGAPCRDRCRSGAKTQS
jgi:thiosulfate/3-mercaptopyruvate sulfurtransferase